MRSCHEGQRRRADFRPLAICVRSRESGTLRGMSVTEEPLDLLADYRREPRGYDEAVDEQGRARASHVGALRALAGRDLEALAEHGRRAGRGRGRLLPLRRSATRRSSSTPSRACSTRTSGRRSRRASASACARSTRFIADVYARAPDRRRGRRAGARDRHGRVPRARDERRASARRHLDRHLRPRPRARRARALPGARGQRAHPERLLLRRRRAARARRPARPRARTTRRGRWTISRRCCASRSRPPRPTPGRSRIALLTDGPDNAAYYEHEWAAKAIGVPLVEPEELAARDDIDIVYRRTNADRLDTGRPAAARAGPQRPHRRRQRLRHRGRRRQARPTPTSRT